MARYADSRLSPTESYSERAGVETRVAQVKEEAQKMRRHLLVVVLCESLGAALAVACEGEHGQNTTKKHDVRRYDRSLATVSPKAFILCVHRSREGIIGGEVGRVHPSRPWGRGEESGGRCRAGIKPDIPRGRGIKRPFEAGW